MEGGPPAWLSAAAAPHLLPPRRAPLPRPDLLAPDPRRSPPIATLPSALPLLPLPPPPLRPGDASPSSSLSSLFMTMAVEMPAPPKSSPLSSCSSAARKSLASPAERRDLLGYEGRGGERGGHRPAFSPSSETGGPDVGGPALPRTCGPGDAAAPSRHLAPLEMVSPLPSLPGSCASWSPGRAVTPAQWGVRHVTQSLLQSLLPARVPPWSRASWSPGRAAAPGRNGEEACNQKSIG